MQFRFSGRSIAGWLAVVLAVALVAVGMPHVVLAASLHGPLAGPSLVGLLIGQTTGTQPSPATDYTGLYEGLKVIFEEPIALALVQDTEAYDLFEQDLNIPVQQSNGGRYIELAHYAADGGGFGARREGGALPESTAPSIFNGRLNLRKNHMTVEMSGETMRRVQQGEASWLTWAKDALPNATRRLRHHLDRESLGFGQGVLGKVTAIAGTLITVNHAFGVTNYSGAIFQFMRNDIIRAAADIDGVVVRVGKMRIKGVNPRTNQITVDTAAAGLIVGDYLAIGDDGGNSFPGAVGAEPVEIMGLLGIIDDGSILATFQNQPRTGAAAVQEYNAVTIDANTATSVAGQFSEDLLLAADDDSFAFGGGAPDFILGHRIHERSYLRNLKVDRVTNDPRSKINQGGKPRGFSILLNGRDVTFRVSRKMPQSIAMMIQKSTLKKWQHGSGFSFDTTTGSVFERVVTGTARYDAYYAVGTLEAQVGCLDPQKNVLIENINPAV